MEAHLMTLVYAKRNPWTHKVEDHFYGLPLTSSCFQCIYGYINNRTRLDLLITIFMIGLHYDRYYIVTNFYILEIEYFCKLFLGINIGDICLLFAISLLSYSLNVSVLRS